MITADTGNTLGGLWVIIGGDWIKPNQNQKTFASQRLRIEQMNRTVCLKVRHGIETSRA